MRRTVLTSLVYAVSTAGCTDPSVAPPRLEPHLAATEFWSGGDLRASATAFAPPAVLPSFFLGDTALAVSRVNDTTIVVHLPTRVGTFPVRIEQGRQSVDLGDISLVGFQDEVLGPYMSGGTYWTPAGGPPVIFGAGDQGAILVDLRVLTASPVVPDSIHSPDCAMSVGPTYLANRFVFEGKSSGGTCGRPQAWSISPVVQREDSGVGSTNTWYVMAQPAPGRWVFNWNNHWDLWRCDSSCAYRSFMDPSGPKVVSISPRGDLYLWTNQCCGATPVFNSQTLDTAFSVAGFQTSGSAFSPGGDTLYLATIDSANRSHLAAVGTAGGAILQDLPLDSLRVDRLQRTHPGAVAVDPAQPRVYAFVMLVEDTLWVPALVVVDRTKWSTLGVLRAPGAALDGRSFYLSGSTTIVPDPADRLVYVVMTSFSYNVHQSSARVLRFNTLP